MLEAGGSHLLDTRRHKFHVSNKEDTEDSILSDHSTTLFPNNTGMLR